MRFEGETCPGYGNDITFRDMTLVAEKKVASRVKRVLEQRHLAKSDWQDDAVAALFSDYVLDSDVVVLNTSFLRSLYESQATSACFKEALHAAACGSRANQLGLDWMVAEASSLYGKALKLLNNALQSPVEVKLDTTLAAIYLVGLYEVCLSDIHIRYKA